MKYIILFFKRLFCNHNYEIESNYQMMININSKFKNTMITKKRCTKCDKIITVIDVSKQ